MKLMYSCLGLIWGLVMGLPVLPSVAENASDQKQLRLARFEVDATPPVGSPLAYDPMKRVARPLSCRGIVLLGAEKPIVLCAVDWIGISNDGQTEWKKALAKAAKTEPDRVAVHALHQHDAPRCDFSANALLAKHGLQGTMFNVEFARETIANAAEAVREAIEEAQPVTHIGSGKAEVKKVASNRRILGADGKVKAMRWTACKDPELRAEPTWTIDPNVRLVSFWNGNEPLAVSSYYATHPQSYYRTGAANPDFPGIARSLRQEATGVFHLHFNGAGGNIGAGKWNDGSKKYRQILAERLAKGMKKAWKNTTRKPIRAQKVDWLTEKVVLPAADHLDEESLKEKLANEELTPRERAGAAKALAWLRQCRQEEPITLSCLRLGEVRILHMPGELAVEYQLGAQNMRPDLFVAMAAYGEYAPGYICLDRHYKQGGYEASEGASRVASDVESVLFNGMRQLLARPGRLKLD